jgi:RNA polymerase sigma-B factor
VIALRFYDELSQAKIAERLDISQMHVSRLQKRALSQLRDFLADEPPTTPRRTRRKL